MRRLSICGIITFTVAVGAAALPAIGIAPATDLPVVLVSRQLADDASLHVGDTVTFAADAAGGHARQFRVGGTYEPTPDPVRFTARRLEARLHLTDLNDMIATADDPASTESVSAINVRLADARDADAFATALAARAPGIVARP